MAEWAKKLCEGPSCQINISIPLSAALAVYDDVTPPSVMLWGGKCITTVQTSTAAACAWRCEMAYWVAMTMINA